MYLPWTIPSNLPYHWTVAYLLLALLLAALSRTRARHNTVAFGH
jgi:hypothetical protein